MELERYKKAGIDPDSFAHHDTEYDAKEMRKEGMIHRDSYSVPNTPVSPLTAGGASRPGEKSWEAAGMGAAAAGGVGANAMRSPVPLLRDGAQSPRVGSPGPQRGPYTPGGMAPGGLQNNSYMQPPTQLVSPIRTPSPGAPPSFPPPASPYRSASGPGTYMRMGSASPGPQQQGYAVPRMQSPAQMNAPPPNRSFSAPRQNQGYGGAGGYGNGGNGGNDYWSQGGFR
jgi:hypothetical protein